MPGLFFLDFVSLRALPLATWLKPWLRDFRTAPSLPAILAFPKLELLAGPSSDLEDLLKLPPHSQVSLAVLVFTTWAGRLRRKVQCLQASLSQLFFFCFSLLILHNIKPWLLPYFGSEWWSKQCFSIGCWNFLSVRIWWVVSSCQYGLSLNRDQE